MAKMPATSASPATFMALAERSTRRRGTAEREARIIPVLYSSETVRTARTTMTAWPR